MISPRSSREYLDPEQVDVVEEQGRELGRVQRLHDALVGRVDHVEHVLELLPALLSRSLDVEGVLSPLQSVLANVLRELVRPQRRERAFRLLN